MNRLSRSLKITSAVVLLTITIIILDASPVMAHAGHSHTDDGISTTMLQVGGTALVLGIAYLVTTVFYRRHDTPGDDT